MKLKHFVLVSLIILAASLLSGCAGALNGSSWSGLTADDQMAYLADGQHVYAVRLNNGNEVWRFPQKADNKKSFFATPLLTPDGQLLVGSAGSDHTLYSLDPQNLDSAANEPKQNWSFSGAQDRWVASQLVVDSTIYAPNDDGTLYVLDLQGNLQWSLPLSGTLWAQPVTDGKLIYVPSLDHVLYAIDPQSHTIAWKVTLGGAIAGSPAVSPNGTLYIGSFASKLEAVDTASQQAHTLANSNGWIWGGPALDGDTLYFGDLDGQFYALGATSGHQSWAPVQPDGPIVGSPLVTPDFVVITTEAGGVYAIDRDGKIVWNQMLGGKIYSAPVAAGDLILAAPMQADFVLAALDQTGKQVWTFTPQK
jgi:outer membrane protein assembly factor BamB